MRVLWRPFGGGIFGTKVQRALPSSQCVNGSVGIPPLPPSFLPASRAYPRRVAASCLTMYDT